MRRIILTILAVGMLLPCTAALAGQKVPQAASAVGRELDRQVVMRLGQFTTPATGVSIMVTTPVDVNDLESSNPLARQMQEEITRWFVQAGYSVQEVRKGASMMIEPLTGEMILTRDAARLENAAPESAAILAGTYTVTPYSIRFNIKLIRSCSQETLAMSTITIPRTDELAPLLRSASAASGMRGNPIEPTVVTLLP